MPDMIASPLNPTFAPVAGGLILVTTSVQTSASNTETPNGFRGIFVKSTATVGFMTLNDINVTVSLEPNTTLWIAGKYVTAITTATNTFAMI
jgi:hypothetical protein